MKTKPVTLNKQKQKKLMRLISVGATLSNFAYNLAQDTRIDTNWRQMLKRQQEDWDAARLEAVDIFRHFES